MSATMFYPKDGAGILTVFIAFGELKGAKSVTGRITPTRSGLAPIDHAREYYEGGTHWWLAFVGALQGQSYDLRVLDNNGAPVGEASGLFVGAPGVNINYPQANSTVPTSFGSYGASSEDGSPLTTMEVRNNSNTIVVNGSIFYQQVIGGDLFFGIAFNNVPPTPTGSSDLYTLKIEHANGVFGTKANLTVA